MHVTKALLDASANTEIANKVLQPLNLMHLICAVSVGLSVYLAARISHKTSQTAEVQLNHLVLL